MKERITSALIDLLLFILFTIIVFLGHYFFNTYAGGEVNYKIHFLIWILTLIVIVSILFIYIYNKKDTIGFVYLGFVVFKMFGIGYLAYFEPDFKNHVILYFIIFWIYLLVEALLVIKCLRKQDKNHVKHIEE